MTPLYRQLADGIRARIVAGTYAAGDALPSERALMAEYALSRVAVRQAVDVLAREGLAVRRRGKGTYVARPRVSHDLTRSSALTGFYDALIKTGREAKVDLLAFRVARPGKHDDVKLPYESIAYVERAFISGSETIIVAISDLHPRAKALARDIVAANLNYEILTEQLGFTIERADISIRAELPSAKIATALKLAAGEPVLVLRRATFAVGDIAIERTAFYIRSSRYEFALTIEEGSSTGQAIRARARTGRR